MWRVVSVLEDGRRLVEGGGLKLIAAHYAEPWPIQVLEDLRRFVEESGARSCVLVGAHIGEPVLALADLCGEIRAYEPDPANCYLLTENLELNGIRATVRCEAASSEDRSAAMDFGGYSVKVESVGVNRIVSGRHGLVAFLCGGCADAASALGCDALSLVRSYVFPASSGLGARLESCGFRVRGASTEALAIGPRPPP
ncbi:MAG: hypothetical protein ACP5ID_00980 [Conexivisphaera sp.]